MKADVPINPNPASLSQVQIFELFDDGAPPRLSFYIDEYELPTPLSIADASLITTSQLLELLQMATDIPTMPQPILIDVRSDDKKIITIRGAWWLNGLGYAFDNIVHEEAMNERMDEVLAVLTKGDVEQPLVFFCANPQCGLSFNAARRAILRGHEAVYWYRGGVEAWYFAGLPLVELKVD